MQSRGGGLFGGKSTINGISFTKSKPHLRLQTIICQRRHTHRGSEVELSLSQPPHHPPPHLSPRSKPHSEQCSPQVGVAAESSLETLGGEMRQLTKTSSTLNSSRETNALQTLLKTLSARLLKGDKKKNLRAPIMESNRSYGQQSGARCKLQ